MARLNIYLSDDLYELAKNWGGSLNLSAICAQALRAELQAADSFRAPGALLAHLKGPNDIERALMGKFSLTDAVISETPPNERLLRSSLGDTAAAYLDRTLQDDGVLAIGGGRQMWCLVRSLSPRRLRLQIAALGVAANDPDVLHIHPNTLVTLLSVLYAPRSNAHLVGWDGFRTLLPTTVQATTDEPRYVVAASCGAFQVDSGFSRLLGREAADGLRKLDALGDFGGVFVSESRTLEHPASSIQSSLLSGQDLQALARRADARILLVAGGKEKRPVIRTTLQVGLCNVLVTDEQTAKALLLDG